MNISFNVPPFVGDEIKYITKAIKNFKISGDGEFTKKCTEILLKITKANKLLFYQVFYDLAKGELISQNVEVIHITPVERTLLNMLGKKTGEVHTREELAEVLGSPESLRTVDVQITRLRKKIEKDTKNPRYLQTVRGKGYMLISE